MDKQKQIEEMAKVYDEATNYARNYLGSLNNAGKWYGNAFYNAGYRKIPEGAVVIPKEISYYEYIEKRLVTAKLYGEKVDFTPEQIMALTTIFHHKGLQEKEIRKETAIDVLEAFICNVVNARLVGVNDDLYYEFLEIKDCLLKEKFGVEDNV